MESLTTKQKYLIAAGALVLTIISYIFLQYKMKSDIVVNSPEVHGASQPVDKVNIEGQKPVPKEIVVHVGGSVNNPGVVRLLEGSRVIEAIEKAGGTLKNADVEKLNLAAVINDGEKIYVPKIGESVQTAQNAGVSQASGGGSSLININTGATQDLDKIPGVGPSTAQKIIDYRKSKGGFKRVEDIKNVSGIGEKKFDKIKKYITI